MKNTLKMLAFIGTTVLTWMTVALVVYLLSADDSTYKDCMVTSGTLFTMVMFGWIPSIIVLLDLDK
jgi:hypothetical protein